MKIDFSGGTDDSSRRKFLAQVGLATGSLLLGATEVFSIPEKNKIQKNSDHTSLGWTVHADGSFTLNTESIQLKNSYPSINGHSIHPMSIELNQSAEESVIKYKLSEGLFTIRLWKKENTYVLSSSISGISKAPHWVQPLSNAEVFGVDKFFKQGLGFAGPSGFSSINSESFVPPKRTESGSDDTWFIESYLVSGLIASDQSTIAIAAHDHRNYLQKSTLSEQQERMGLINRHLLTDTVLFQSGFSTEEITLSDKILNLPDLYFHIGKDPLTALRDAAVNIGKEMKARTQQESRYHWCSWYIKEEKYTQADLVDFLGRIKKIKPTIPLQTIQIDDGYAHRGAWLEPREGWPGGLQKSFELIKKNGYKAGIWIGPFMVQKFTKTAKQHPDWMLHDLDGNLVVEWNHYILDSSHPDAFNYLRTVFKTYKKYGVTFYKTDFMDWGLKDSTKVKRYTPGKTSIQYFRDVLAMIREEIGEESYWLGCIAPFAPFLGFADGMRTSNDTNKKWLEGSQGNMFQEMYADQYFNQVFWHNDPDVVFLSKDECNLNDDEIHTLAYSSGILAASVNNSGLFKDTASIDLWRFIIPPPRPEPARFPFWGKENKLYTVVRYYKELGAWGVFFANISSNPVSEKYSIQDLIGEKDITAFDWNHAGSKNIGKIASLEINLDKHQSKLYYLSKTNSAAPANLTIGGRLLT